MTERMIENRVNKLRELEAQQKEIEAAAEAIRAELKADLEEKGVDELKTKNFILRWKEIISNRLDCQRQFEIVRKRRRNFVVFRRGGGNKNQLLPCWKSVFTICCFWRINSLRSFRR